MCAVYCTVQYGFYFTISGLVTIQMKVIQQYFHVVLFIMLYKVVLSNV